MAGPIEAKAYVGTLTTFGAGYLSTLLLETVPWLNQHLTPDQQTNLPIFIATVLTAITTYYAPHTHRPDLPTPIPVQPAYPPEVNTAPPKVPQPIIPPGPATPLEAPSSRSPE